MPRKRSESASSESPKKEKLEDKLVENIIELQKVHTQLLEKFDGLSKNIENLLSLFEMAARSFAQHPANQITEKDKDFLEKIDKLLDQNKTIAKGLTLMEERMREKVYGSSPQEPKIEKEESFQPSQGSRPLPRF